MGFMASQNYLPEKNKPGFTLWHIRCTNWDSPIFKNKHRV